MAGFASPEEAALATWADSPRAHAWVVAVDIRGDRAEVIIDTEPSYRDYVYCQRRRDGWCEVVSGNGPTVGWDDPSFIQWG